MGTAAAIAIISSKIAATGFLLGMGFWGSKKLTNYLDYRLKLIDKDFMNTIGNEFPFGTRS